MRAGAFLALFCVVQLPVGSSGCVPGDAGHPPPVNGFNDHTTPTLATVADFEAIAADGASSSALKFVTTRFLTAGENVRFLDSDHYKLHDEWWWFRLMNGQPNDGVTTAPVHVGRLFDTVDAIVEWARERVNVAAPLPLDLTFVQDNARLYSPGFYALALNQTPKVLGIGTVLHFAARPDVGITEQWAIELEFTHAIDREELEHFFRVLRPALPAEVGDRLKLLVRSQQQEQFASDLVATGDPLAARILRYSEVTVPGETEVYSQGLTAGRLKFIRAGESGLQDTLSTDILVLEQTPDFLPQCAGLITAVPQTALAHVNILAKNRGIPNAYRGGIMEEPDLDQLARIRAPVVIKASGANELVVKRMTEAEFSQYRTLTQIPDSEPFTIDTTGIDVAYDLTSLAFADEATWRPVLGGKSTGYLALLDTDNITTPLLPLGISIVPFLHHTEELRATLQNVLIDPVLADVDVRYLMLEGSAAFIASHPNQPNFPTQFLATRGNGDALRDIIERGGIAQMIVDKPMDTADLAALTSMLEQNFGSYADAQPLRFRSSSNIEDAEGFNGAGLYTSNSGFLHAANLTGSDSRKTVQSAIKTTWSSYWRSQAFEERRLAHADHLSGSMAVAVHAGFPNSVELSNGVFTFTLLPPGHPDGRAVLDVNVQQGALSVTNPPPGDVNLPEVDRLYQVDGTITIDRVRRSTLDAPGQVALTDEQLLELFDEADRVTTLWLDTQNEALLASQRRSTLTLDFEMREVRAGWPALATGAPLPSRVVVKQARTLEPSLVRVSSLVRGMPFPRDVLARARRVEQRRCESASVVLTVTDAITDVQKLPDMGYAVAPFTAFVLVEHRVDAPEFGAIAGTRRSANHLVYTATRPGMLEGGPWAVDVVVDDDAVDAAGFAHAAYDGTTVVVQRGDARIEEPATCTTLVLHASPEDFLEALITTP